MYVLEKLIIGYRDIVEQESMLGKLVDWPGSMSGFVDGVTKASNFFERNVLHHMEMEEKVLYPVIRRILPREKIDIIHSYERDHKMIKNTITAFRDAVRMRIASTKDEDRKQIVQLYKEVLKIVVAHARQEYELLPTLIKENFKAEDYREVDSLYAAFVRM